MDEHEQELSMPFFDEAVLDGVENIVLEIEKVAPKKRGRKPAEVQLTEEQKKEKMKKYYEDNKEHRLKYKQASRGSLKSKSNKASMTIEHFSRLNRQQGKKPTTNLDFITYDGMKRTLTIEQPTDEIIALLRSNGILITETITGVPEL